MHDVRGSVLKLVRGLAGPLRSALARKTCQRRARITRPIGKLPLSGGPATFVAVVGSAFDQGVPTARVCIQMGYCKAFEQLGIPYVLSDAADLDGLLPSLTRPFCYLVGNDYAEMSRETVRSLRKHPHFVWVDRWFAGSDEFFRRHDLDARAFTFPDHVRRMILESEPSFAFTATVERGLCFFEGWERHGLRVLSVPLACDTTLYNPSAPHLAEFAGIRLAFVGGYWKSKGEQIDRYLRPFEDDLVVYGYSQWPYKGYRGMLSREAEPSLYRQALVSPTINEPTVGLLHGNINERVFKVLGSGGVTVVDAVPAYRELFTEEELIIPEDERAFARSVRQLLGDAALRAEYGRRGYRAVLSRHTYGHRARMILKQLGLADILMSIDSAEPSSDRVSR